MAVMFEWLRVEATQVAADMWDLQTDLGSIRLRRDPYTNWRTLNFMPSFVIYIKNYAR